MNKKILITGSCGFIGNCMVKLLLMERPNWKIIGLDSLTYAANPDTMAWEKNQDNFKFYLADIRDLSVMDSIFKLENPDIVINFAAESHVDNSILNPDIFIDTNIKGVKNLLELCKKYNIERFHQVSTDEVYGDFPLESKELFTENNPLRASSPYSASKASADLLCLAYYRTYNTPITISRCSNNYGPYQFPEKLIPLMINNAIQDKDLPVYGTGLNIRDWLYVEDHCRGILACIEKGKAGQVYNFGGNNEKTNLEIINTILNQIGTSNSKITYVADRKGHDLRYAIDATKAKKELGWVPTVNFEAGIKFTIDWYLANSYWINGCLSK